MKYLICDFYEDFKCIGDRCPYTCCAGGWDISIDKDTKEIYDCAGGEFGQKLKQNIRTVNDTEFQFLLTKDHRCPFLTPDNLCEIYQKLGADKLCATCRNYPRTCKEYGDLAFYTLTLSCPEVSRILLNKTEPVSFLFGEDDRKGESNALNAFDWNYFNTLTSCFTFSIELLQNRSYPLSARLRLLLIFTNTLQLLLNNHKDITPLLETFSSPEYIKGQAETLSLPSSNIPSVFSAFLHFHQTTETLREGHFLRDFTTAVDEFLHSAKGDRLWERIRNGLCLLSDPKYDIHYEHLCVYFLFRYYFRAYETRNPLEEVAQLVYVLLIYRGYALPFCSDKEGISVEKQISLFSAVSRTFEHVPQNLAALSASFKKDGQQDICFLLSIL